MMRVAGETVTIVRPDESTTFDRYGNPIPGPDARITVPGCAVAPRSSSEENTARAGVIVGVTLFAPPGTEIRPSDRVEARGGVWEVDGQPGDWRSPFTRRWAGVEVALRRVEG